MAFKAEHPRDVLHFAVSQIQAGNPCALAVLTGTEGGSVRAPGALMAVTKDGTSCGYLSGGCIDADIVIQAQDALQEGAARTLRYGRGSPFLDIKLPCGGGIDVTIFPSPPLPQMTTALASLADREVATLSFSTSSHTYDVAYQPKLRLRIAGRSADPIALARISVAAGLETELWSPDETCLTEAENIGCLTVCPLQTPSNLPTRRDDKHSAFVLMMHDTDWELPLLRQALSGPAFYIGAVGSPATHKSRCDRLRQSGLSNEIVTRVHGPIGLVPSLRDASMLAISTLAEIIAAHSNAHPVLSSTRRETLHV